MLARLKFVWAVNGSLQDVDVHPSAFDKTYYNSILEITSAAAFSSEEVAMFFHYQLPPSAQTVKAARTIARWRRDGKVREDVERKAQLVASGVDIKEVFADLYDSAQRRVLGLSD